MKICLDPGHSGPFEPGAVAAGICEADINLDVANKLAAWLVKHSHDVRLTRDNDVDDDGLAWRAQVANEWGADIFISLHCNAAASPYARGVETYIYSDSAAGLCIAKHIQGQLMLINYTLDRGVKEANFAVLRLTAMPAVLVEMGFITNDDDRAFLVSQAGQDAIAHAIADAIRNWSML